MLIAINRVIMDVILLQSKQQIYYIKMEVYQRILYIKTEVKDIMVTFNKINSKLWYGIELVVKLLPCVRYFF